MRTKTLTAVLSAALLASLAPLTSDAAQHANGSQSDRTPDLQHVQRQWSAASRALMNYSVAQRDEALRELRQQRNRVAEWYGGMEHGSAHAWEQVKRGFVTAYGELNSALGKAAKEFERG